MYNEHHHVAPQPQDLQAQFTVRSAPILSGKGIAGEHDIDTDEVEPMNHQIAKTLGFVIGDDEFIVDSNELVGRFAPAEREAAKATPMIRLNSILRPKIGQAPGSKGPQTLRLRADEAIE